METIKKAIITDLTNGKTLTVLDGLTMYRTIDLRKYISDLRAEGNLISDRWVKSNGKKFKQYFIARSYQFKCFVLSIVLLTSCHKVELIDAIKDGAKLTKADAGISIYQGVWWSEKSKDSLVIQSIGIKRDSVYYISNMSAFDKRLTHVVGYKQKDDNLELGGMVWRLEH
jgi:hypothetical protein